MPISTFDKSSAKTGQTLVLFALRTIKNSKISTTKEKSLKHVPTQIWAKLCWGEGAESHIKWPSLEAVRTLVSEPKQAVRSLLEQKKPKVWCQHVLHDRLAPGISLLGELPRGCNYLAPGIGWVTDGVNRCHAYLTLRISAMTTQGRSF